MSGEPRTPRRRRYVASLATRRTVAAAAAATLTCVALAAWAPHGVTLAGAHANRLAPMIAAGELPPEMAPFSARRFNDVRTAA